MQRNTVVRTTVAAGVAGLGLSLGGIALASADDGSNQGPPGSMAFDGQRQPGPGGHGPGMIEGQFTADLAEALGVSEEDVEAALEAIREELAPEPPADGERPEPPTAAEMEERRQAFAEALAAELDVPVDDVVAALDVLHAEHEAEARTMLAKRLTAAVKAGDLTRADRASVLKAFDAGVLGGPGFGPGR